MSPLLARRGRHLLLALAPLILLAPLLTSCKQLRGQWDPVQSWPIVAIHAAITPDGKVFTYGTGTDGVLGGAISVYDLWDPETGVHETLGNPTAVDLFCSTQVRAAGTDDILTAGGDNGIPDNSRASRGVTRYSAALGLRNSGEMIKKRWYGTGNTLPNGDILVEGGSAFSSSGPAETTPEIYSPDTGWRLLTGADSTYAYGDEDYRWWYPRSWVAPDGRMFGISGTHMYYLDTGGNGSITPAGTLPRTNVGISSTAVMYRPGKILQVGGGAFSDLGDVDSTNKATVIDINGTTPTVTEVAPMKYPRHWATATVLPGGNVLVTGGANGQNRLRDVAKNPELYLPDLNVWIELEAEVHPRLYHSSAILLPDARVLVGGGGSPGPVTNLNAQIYSPGYLFDEDAVASRPTVSAPATVDYGTNFSLTVSADVTRVSFIRAGAVTHSFNSGQRYMELALSGSGTSRTATAPANANLAPPGTYLLFALNAAGVPSVAELVEIEP